jgi:hypothetical protein
MGPRLNPYLQYLWFLSIPLDTLYGTYYTIFSHFSARLDERAFRVYVSGRDITTGLLCLRIVHLEVGGENVAFLAFCTIIHGSRHGDFNFTRVLLFGLQDLVCRK